MSTSLPKAEKKAKYVDVQVRYLEQPFKWQMVFNRFAIERVGEGKMIRFWYHQSATPEIIPVFISKEGLAGLKSSSESYAKAFASVPPHVDEDVPPGRMLSPMFSNIIRLSCSGDCGEVAFYLLPLHEIAMIAKGDKPAKETSPALPVVLLHSTTLIHRQMVMELLSI